MMVNYFLNFFSKADDLTSEEWQEMDRRGQVLGRWWKVIMEGVLGGWSVSMVIGALAYFLGPPLIEGIRFEQNGIYTVLEPGEAIFWGSVFGSFTTFFILRIYMFKKDTANQIVGQPKSKSESTRPMEEASKGVGRPSGVRVVDRTDEELGQKASKTPLVNEPKKYTGKYSNLEIVEPEEGLVTQILGYPVPPEYRRRLEAAQVLKDFQQNHPELVQPRSQPQSTPEAQSPK